MKRILRKFLFSYRYSTQDFRSLPHFIIIGAQKSGTSSLFYYLSQHPQVIPSLKKEVHYFDGGLNPSTDNFKRGSKWYRAHFPFGKTLGARRITGEASPLYIFNPLAARRIYHLVPTVKLIAILRNPTERAISHYFHEKGKGRESLSIVEAFQEEDKLVTKAKSNEEFGSNSFLHRSYKNRSLYREQIERYLQYFSMNQLFVLNSEAFFSRTGDSLKKVFGFLGIDENVKINNLTPRNVAANRTKVAPEVYQYLDDFFSSHNQALYQLLGKTFDW